MAIDGKSQIAKVDTMIEIYGHAKKFMNNVKDEAIQIVAETKKLNSEQNREALKGGAGQIVIDACVALEKSIQTLSEAVGEIGKDVDGKIAHMLELNKDKAGFSDIQAKIAAQDKEINALKRH